MNANLTTPPSHLGYRGAKKSTHIISYIHTPKKHYPAFSAIGQATCTIDYIQSKETKIIAQLL